VTQLIGSDRPISGSALDALSALLDTLLPASGDGRMPSAADVDFLGHLERFDVQYVPQLATVLHAFDDAFARLDLAARVAQVARVAQGDPAAFRQLIRRVYDSYYQSDRVRIAIGVTAGPPFPEGNTVDAGDLSLLDPVIRNSERYGYRRAQAAHGVKPRVSRRSSDRLSIPRSKEPRSASFASDARGLRQSMSQRTPETIRHSSCPTSMSMSTSSARASLRNKFSDGVPLPVSSFEMCAGVTPTRCANATAVRPRTSRHLRVGGSPASSRSTTSAGTVASSPLARRFAARCSAAASLASSSSSRSLRYSAIGTTAKAGFPLV